MQLRSGVNYLFSWALSAQAASSCLPQQTAVSAARKETPPPKRWQGAPRRSKSVIQQPGQVDVPNRKDLGTSGLLSTTAFSARQILLQSGFHGFSISTFKQVVIIRIFSTPLAGRKGLSSFIACMGSPKSRVHSSCVNSAV